MPQSTDRALLSISVEDDTAEVLLVKSLHHGPRDVAATSVGQDPICIGRCCSDAYDCLCFVGHEGELEVRRVVANHIDRNVPPLV